MTACVSVIKLSFTDNEVRWLLREFIPAIQLDRTAARQQHLGSRMLIRGIFCQLEEADLPRDVGNGDGDPPSVPAEPIAINQRVRNTPFIEIPADSIRQCLMVAERLFRTRCGCGHERSVALADMTQTEGTIITT